MTQGCLISLQFKETYFDLIRTLLSYDTIVGSHHIPYAGALPVHFAIYLDATVRGLAFPHDHISWEKISFQ
jgi:hypothetical protein